MNNRKSDYRLESLMLELGLTKFLSTMIETLEAFGDEDDRTRKLRHGLHNILKEYWRSALDTEDDGG